MNHFRTIISTAAIAFMLTGGIASIVMGAPSSGENEVAQKKGDFIRGIKVWGETCTRCHNLRDPKEFNDREWQIIVTHMRVRAGVTGQDMRDILAFMQQSN